MYHNKGQCSCFLLTLTIQGKLNGKEGFFPLAFTELYSSSDDVTSDKSKAGLVVHAGQEEHGEDL